MVGWAVGGIQVEFSGWSVMLFLGSVGKECGGGLKERKSDEWLGIV